MGWTTSRDGWAVSCKERARVERQQAVLVLSMSPRRGTAVTLTQNIDNCTPLLTFCMLQIRYPVRAPYHAIIHNTMFRLFWHLFMGPLSYRLLLLYSRISVYPRLVAIDTSTSASTDRNKRRRLALFWCLCWLQHSTTRHVNNIQWKVFPILSAASHLVIRPTCLDC